MKSLGYQACWMIFIFVGSFWVCIANIWWGFTLLLTKSLTTHKCIKYGEDDFILAYEKIHDGLLCTAFIASKIQVVLIFTKCSEHHNSCFYLSSWLFIIIQALTWGKPYWHTSQFWKEQLIFRAFSIPILKTKIMESIWKSFHFACPLVPISISPSHTTFALVELNQSINNWWIIMLNSNLIRLGAKTG